MFGGTLWTTCLLHIHAWSCFSSTATPTRRLLLYAGGLYGFHRAVPPAARYVLW